MSFQFLMKEELGNNWLQPGLFRIGASSLLADIERQLEYYRHRPLRLVRPSRDGVREEQDHVRR